MSGVAKASRAFHGCGKIIPLHISVDASVDEVEIPIRLTLVVSFYKVRKLIEQQQMSNGKPLAELTSRQTTVLNGILQSQSNKEIASSLNLTERAVKFHVADLLRIFNVHSRNSLRDEIFGKVTI